MPKELDFQFNTTDFQKSGTVGSHDPCVMQDPQSKVYYSYSTDNSVDQDFPGIGIQIRKSTDLEHWTYVGVALSDQAIAQARDNGAGNPSTETFWAPDVSYADGEYRMYYAATKEFGSSESKIWLAAAKKPEGPFENKGVVVSSWSEGLDPDAAVPNAIDPFLIGTPEGKQYLAYGSFFAGIFLKELKPDGFAVNQDRSSKDYFGTCIANKGGSPIDGPEGSSVLYDRNTGYYFLFLSYGWLGDTYDIRVGRSKNVTGPYLDYKGHKLTDDVAGVTTGTKLACSYRFSAAKPGGKQAEPNSSWEWGGFRAPGGGVPLFSDGQYFFVHHIRDGAAVNHTESDGQANYFMHYLMVRKMYFINGWPVLSPEPYAGETDQKITPDYLSGKWEIIVFTDDDNNQKTARNLTLYPPDKNGTGTFAFGNKQGSWSYQAESDTLQLRLKDSAPFMVTAKVSTCWDLENSRATLCLTGLTDTGITVWGKYL